MASDAKRTQTQRRRKAASRGKVRKAKLRNKGSTKSKKALFGD